MPAASGYADAAETLDVSAPDEGGSNENFTLLGLVNLGGIAAIELTKSYIYNGSVTGIVGGYQVETTNAYAWKTAEWNEDKNKAACAGGFGGLSAALSAIVRQMPVPGQRQEPRRRLSERASPSSRWTMWPPR